MAARRAEARAGDGMNATMYEATINSVRAWTVLGIGSHMVTVASKTSRDGRMRFQHNGRFHDSWATAKAHVVSDAEARVHEAEQELRDAKLALRKACELRPGQIEVRTVQVTT
jgi:hypothetical protein